MTERTVFFVSDGTGITAETFGNSILAQFPARHRHVRRPFVDSVEKAHHVVTEINQTAEREGMRPVVFITLVSDEVREIVTASPSKGIGAGHFRTFVEPLEHEFGIKSNHRVGRFSDASASQEYNDRIEAINFSLAHDDGQSVAEPGHRRRDPAGRQPQRQDADGAVPGDAARHQGRQLPADPGGFERGRLPTALMPHKRKCFGLTIDPERLAQIRNERRPGSKYAALTNCRYEVNEAESMMRREGISWLSSTHKSIEEIATTILRDLRPDRLIY